jgi:hypothetical protein
LGDIWQCTDCPTKIRRHPDPAHESQGWTEQFIATHEATHAAQLLEHDGDREALRHRLNHPARFAAVKQHAALTSTDERQP